MNRQLLRRKFRFIYNIYVYFIQKTEDKKLIGERKSFGEENPEKIFLVIWLNNYGLGLMAIRGSVLGYLRIAKLHGYIPVVDLMNYDNGYLEKDEIGKVNAWEYYFEQPSGYTLEEVYRSKNVVMASGINPREAGPASFKSMLENKKKAKFYYKLSNDYLHLKSEILREIDEEYNILIGDKRVIGVVNRGSDLINCPGHTIQPSVQEVIDKARSLLVKWNCDYVFLASEEEYVVSIFRENFGNKLLVNKSSRIDQFEENVPFVDISFNRVNDKYLKGLEYLTTVVILSRCNCLIGSLVGKTISAIEMNRRRFENTYIFDRGVY